MAICGCGLPAHCCQPAVAGGFIYVDLWDKLSTHLAPQALFTQSCVHDATATSFLLSKHTGGGDTAPAFSGLHVYLQLTWKVVFPPLLCSFPPTTAFTSFPAPDCWVCAAAPAFPGPACLFTAPGRSPLSSSLAIRVPHPLCYVSLLFLLLITQFPFFSLGGGRSVQGAMLIWPRVVCGSTAYHLAHLMVCVFPSRLGAGVWFLCLT
jgi:hypothetical protein